MEKIGGGLRRRDVITFSLLDHKIDKVVVTSYLLVLLTTK